jgi:GxxExxY protein
MVEIVDKELSYVVYRCIFDVHNEVGPGLREESYQKAMEVRLAHEGLEFIAKPHTRRDLIFHGEPAVTFEPDLIIE